MHPKDMEEIMAAREMAAVDKTRCRSCGTPLGQEGVVVETKSRGTFALCQKCYGASPPGDLVEVQERSYLYERLGRFPNPCHDERVIWIALDLGLKITDRRGNEILWGFGGSSGGWFPDGNDAPSWYGKAATRWTDFVLRMDNGEYKICNPRYPVSVEIPDA